MSLEQLELQVIINPGVAEMEIGFKFDTDSTRVRITNIVSYSGVVQRHVV